MLLSLKKFIHACEQKPMCTVVFLICQLHNTVQHVHTGKGNTIHTFGGKSVRFSYCLNNNSENTLMSNRSNHYFIFSHYIMYNPIVI